MTSKEIFALIELAAATNSKNDKLAIIAQHKDDAEFKRVLQLALDPTITFGMQKVPLPGVHKGESFNDRTWKMLDEMASRRLTGGAAQEYVYHMMELLDEESAELLKRIIRKDLRAGFSESTVNKAIKGLIPDFPYMRCSLPKDVKLETFDWATGVISQEKADGMFANIDHETDGTVRITSRQGSPFPSEPFASLIAEVQTRLAPGFEHHGELLVLRDGQILPREVGNGILNSVLKGGHGFAKNEIPLYMVWDAIPLSEVKPKGSYKTAYKRRLVQIINQLRSTIGSQIRVIPTKVVHSLLEAYQHCAEMMEKGKEGTIIKDPRAIWRDATSKEQVKLKLEADVDLEIVGFNPGTGKNEQYFGSIAMQTSCGQLRVNVAVSGFKAADVPLINARREELLGTIMTVKANSIMKPSASSEYYSLFLPRFVEFRNDKTKADDLARVQEQFDNAIKNIVATLLAA